MLINSHRSQRPKYMFRYILLQYHFHWQNNPFRAIAFLRRLPGFSITLDIWFALLLMSNSQPGGLDPCIYATPSQWQGRSVIPPGTRFTFYRLLPLSGLWQRYSNLPIYSLNPRNIWPLVSLTNSMELSTTWEPTSHLRTSQHFMEPRGSLPHSQEPTTGSYPVPDQSSPHPPVLSLQLMFYINYFKSTELSVFKDIGVICL
jgi:hypothetical protein